MDKRQYTRTGVSGLLLIAIVLLSIQAPITPKKPTYGKGADLYAFYAVSSVNTTKESEQSFNLGLQLFFVLSLITLILHPLRPKTRGPLLLSCCDRNYFYDYTTIHAP